MAGTKAVFIDRDGVLIRDADYLADVSGLSVFKGTAPALKLLRRAGFKIVVVTNQSGVARGYFTEAAVRRIHAELKRRLAKSGARWDALYYSPHGPDSGHSWRKPGTGMLLAAKRRFKLDLKASWMIGDKTSDIECARRAGCSSVLVRTGNGGKDKAYKVRPTATKRDILAAARWIAARALVLLLLAPLAVRADTIFLPAGCSGEAILQALAVKPAIPCLKIEADNCHGGVFDVANNCDGDVTIGPLTWKKGQIGPMAELYRDKHGRTSARAASGNVASYMPTRAVALTAEGSAAGKKFTLGYWKMPRLVDPAEQAKLLPYATFTEEQMVLIVDSRLPGAMKKAQVIYHYFKPAWSIDPSIAVPAWLKEPLKSMRRPVFTDPDEGDLNEAQLWQGAAAVLYEYFIVVQRTLPPAKGGQSAAPGSLRQEFVYQRENLETALKRLRDAKRGSALGARSKPLLAGLYRIVAEMRRVEGAIDAGSEGRFVESVMAVATRTSDWYADLQKN